ncbi:MAG: hypothetical protein IJ106_10400 [Parasporobacterium sp.]|nr:hypothetical protein [Parasporobacterium sp.]
MISIWIGIGLSALFIILRLFGAIPWAWIWVLSPLWIEAGLYVAVIAFAFVIAVISGGIESLKNKKILEKDKKERRYVMIISRKRMEQVIQRRVREGISQHDMKTACRRQEEKIWKLKMQIKDLKHELQYLGDRLKELERK